MNQLRLDFGESAEAERVAETAIRAQRARALESAAVAIGARAGEVLYRVAGTLAVFVDSPSQRAMGLTGLRWCGTWAELATRLDCSAESVSRAVRRLRSSGIVTTTNTVDDRGAVVGVCVEIQMKVVHQLTANLDAITPPGAAPDVGPGAAPSAAPFISRPHLIPVLPKYPKNPPPRTAGAELGNFGSQKTTFGSQTVPGGSQTPQGTNTQGNWDRIAAELQTAGVQRSAATIAAAKASGMDPAAVGQVIAEYNTHRRRFDGPGALVDRIRNGAWPVELPTAESLERSAAAVSATKSQFKFEQVRGQIVMAARRRGQAITDEQADELATRALQGAT
jgi:hypothetical protein